MENPIGVQFARRLLQLGSSASEVGGSSKDDLGKVLAHVRGGFFSAPGRNGWLWICETTGVNFREDEKWGS